MCVCVFLRSMCLKFLLRDVFERLLCWLDHWLSCMLDCIHVYVFHSRKTGFKKWFDTSSIPPWHLAVCRDSSAISYRFPDSSSILGGSIEKAPASSIASRHLVDRSSFCSWIWWVVPRYLLDTSAVDDHFLNTYLESFLDTCIYRALLRVYIYFPHDPFLISSICPHLFISQTLSLSLQTSSFMIFQTFSRLFFSW